MSPASASVTTSAGSPSMTARAWRPGAAVRLADAHILAGGLLPVLREGDVDVFVELARRIVGRIEQRDFARGPFAAGRPAAAEAHTASAAARILPFDHVPGA